MPTVTTDSKTTKSATTTPFFKPKGQDAPFHTASSHTPFIPPTIQAKLSVGQPNDKYEQEADTIADKVANQLATPQPSNKPHLDKPAFSKSAQQVHHKLSAGSSPQTVSPQLESKLASSKSGGSTMDSSTQQQMESSFGSDFGNVKIHTDSNAIQMNKDLGANAFTNQSDIYFNAGKYAPGTQSGNQLLAHELTHVLQQGYGSSIDSIQRDLAVEPANPTAVARELTAEEIQDAIEYNNRKFKNEEELMNLRDVLGLSPEPAVIDEDMIRVVAQWQAENNLTQDGKIGPRTATVIGTEMLGEATFDPSQQARGIQMLERGIVLSFSNNSYVDTANTSTKTIRWNVHIPVGLNMRDYALVNFLRGSMTILPLPTHPNVRMYGALVPFNFPAEQVDSVDTDPIYASNAGARWNFIISGRTFYQEDTPGPRPGNVFNLGESADVDFRIAVFRVRDLPLVTAGDVGTARPITQARWRYSVLRDAVTGAFSHP